MAKRLLLLLLSYFSKIWMIYFTLKTREKCIWRYLVEMNKKLIQDMWTQTLVSSNWLSIFWFSNFQFLFLFLNKCFNTIADCSIHGFILIDHGIRKISKPWSCVIPLYIFNVKFGKFTFRVFLDHGLRRISVWCGLAVPTHGGKMPLRIKLFHTTAWAKSCELPHLWKLMVTYGEESPLKLKKKKKTNFYHSLSILMQHLLLRYH